MKLKSYTCYLKSFLRNLQIYFFIGSDPTTVGVPLKFAGEAFFFDSERLCNLNLNPAENNFCRSWLFLNKKV